VLPAKLRAQLPAEVQPFVEQDADEEGDLEVLHVDHVDHVNDYYWFRLRTAKGRLSLAFTDAAPDLPTGTRIRARGMKIGKTLALAQAGATQVAPAVLIDPNAPMAGTLGAQKTLVMMVTFADAPSQPFTAASAGSVVFGNASSFDYAASYQQTWPTGDVAGWFTIATSSAACDIDAILSQSQAGQRRPPDGCSRTTPATSTS
jgi:hypothetical protein